MSDNSFDKILIRSFKYRVAPYLLRPEDYWDYIEIKRFGQQNTVTRDLFVLSGVAFLLLMATFVFFRNWWVALAAILSFGSLLLYGIYFISSKSVKCWWITLVTVALLLLILSFWFISIHPAGILLTYFSVSHLISLIRVNKFVIKI